MDDRRKTIGELRALEAEEERLEQERLADKENPQLQAETFGDWLCYETQNNPHPLRLDEAEESIALLERGKLDMSQFSVAELTVLLMQADTPTTVYELVCSIKERFIDWIQQPPPAPRGMAHNILHRPLGGTQ